MRSRLPACFSAAPTPASSSPPRSGSSWRGSSRPRRRSSSHGPHAEWVLRRGNLLLGGLFVVMVAWAVVSLTETRPLDEPLGAEQLDGWQTVLAVLGVALLRAGGTRLLPAVPAPSRAFRVRVRDRLRAARGGDGRHRVGAQLAALVVGVARADGQRVRRHRRSGPQRVARGALQPALPRRDARRREGREHPLRRPRRVHPLRREARPDGGRGDAQHLLREAHPAPGAGRWGRPRDRRRRAHGRLRGRRPSHASGTRGAAPPAIGAPHRRRARRLAALPGRSVERRGALRRPRRVERAPQARVRGRRREPDGSPPVGGAGRRRSHQPGHLSAARRPRSRRSCRAARGEGKGGAVTAYVLHQLSKR